MTERLGSELGDIVKIVDRLEERLDFVVDRHELGDAICAAVEVGHRVEALISRLAMAATRNAVAANEGHRTIGQYVAARTNSRAVQIDRINRRARWLRDFPVLEAAHGAELTAEHVDYMKKHLDGNYEVHRRLVADQQRFIDIAAECSFEGFATACDYWLVHIDPDGKEPTDQIEKATFRIGKGQGGRGELSGMCDAVTAQQIRTAVEHEAAKLRRQDKQHGVERTDGQRRMAALAALVARGFARSDGSVPAPLGSIVMSLGVAEWALAQLAGNQPCDPSAPDVVPVDASDVDRRCELLDGTPIHPFLAVAALGLAGPDGNVPAAVLRRYVLEADSRLLDVSVNARSFPEWMRTAALVQSRGRCGNMGCDSPHHWIEIDHVHPVAAGGETCMGNADPLCSPDNRAKGATTGHIPWRDRPPPLRRRPRSRPRRGQSADSADGDLADDADRF